MAEAQRFVDGVSYTEAQYMEYQKRLMSKNGVVANENLESSTSELAVIAATPNAMSVLVGTGECFTQGEFYQNTAAKTLTISAADASWNRYDRIVVGVDWSANTCGPYVLTGTPAASPAEPSLTQTAAKWEIPLAKLLVTAGVTEISGNLTTLITDERYWCACNLGPMFINTSGQLDASSNRIIHVGTPTDDTDADTVGARNTAIAAVGGNWKAPVVAATTAAITLASDVENGDTLDGVTLATGDRILVKNQSDGGNGIYVVKASGAPDRATDFDSAVDALGSSIPVSGGTINGGTAWRTANKTIASFGTTVLVFDRYMTRVSSDSTDGSVICREDAGGTPSGTKWHPVGPAILRPGVYHVYITSFTSSANWTLQIFASAADNTQVYAGTPTVDTETDCGTVTVSATKNIFFLYSGTAGATCRLRFKNADGITY